MNLELTSGTGLIGRWGLNEGAGSTTAGSVGGIGGSLTLGTSWVAGAPALVPSGAAPGTPVVVAPLDDATGVTLPPTLDVTVSDTDSTDLDVTFYGRSTAAGPSGEDFTIVAIPDTQNYVDYTRSASVQATRNAIYQAQMNWIVSSKDQLNTVFASHLGDITNAFEAAAGEVEWQKASTYQAILDSNGIRNNMSPGNHDFSNNGAGPGTQFYDQYFPPSRYQGFNWYGGYLGDPNDGVADGGMDRLNKDNYELFSAGGMDFLIIHLEMDMPAYSTTWAQNVINKYPNRHVIISTHAFVNASGQRSTNAQYRADGQSAQTVWTNLIAPNCQIFMVINGHYHGQGRRTDNNSCGEPVFQLNSDYQDLSPDGGNGYLRYYTFHPAQDQIEAFTYSPTLNSFDVPNMSDDHFTVNWEMDGPAPFTEIGTVQDVQPGQHATLPWAGLARGTEYEWYAAVTDGDHTTNGPTSSFTTEVPPPTPPVVDSVAIDQATPDTDDVLSVTTTSHDVNGDAVTYTYEWLKNGSAFGPTGATLDLGAPGNGDRGDQISVRVTAHDASSASAPVTSAAVTIANTPPTATVSLSDTTPASSSTVTATATKADVDGDTVTLTYVWAVNGTVKRTNATTALTDTFDLSVTGNGDQGDALTVTVTPNDGTANGSGVSAPGVVAPDVPAPLFADDFSGGNLASWTTSVGVTIDGAGGAPVPSARLQGSGTKANASKTLAAPVSGQTCLSADVSLTSGATSLLYLQTVTGGKIIRVQVNNSGQLTVRSDVTATVLNSKVAMGTGYHALELCGTVGTSSQWDLLRDGVVIVNDWTVSTGTTPVGRVMIGDPANKTVTFNVDNVRLDQAVGDGLPRPSAPGAPFASSTSVGTVQLTWAASTSPFPPVTYRIYRDGGQTPFDQTTATSYQDGGLTPGSHHTYTVDAVDLFGNASAMSPPSNSVTVSAGSVPAIFADDFTGGTMGNWTASSNLTVDGTAGTPAPSARAQVTSLPAYAYANLSTTYSQVCMSMDVNLQTNVGTILMRLKTNTGANVIRVYVNATRKILIKSDVSGGSLNSGVALPTGWHALEVCGTVGTNSAWDVTLDGTPIITGWVSSTGVTPIGRIQIGDTAAKTITVNYDHVRLDQVAGG